MAYRLEFKVSALKEWQKLDGKREGCQAYRKAVERLD